MSTSSPMTPATIPGDVGCPDSAPHRCWARPCQRTGAERVQVLAPEVQASAGRRLAEGGLSGQRNRLHPGECQLQVSQDDGLQPRRKRAAGRDPAARAPELEGDPGLAGHKALPPGRADPKEPSIEHEPAGRIPLRPTRCDEVVRERGLLEGTPLEPSAQREHNEASCRDDQECLLGGVSPRRHVPCRLGQHRMNRVPP